MKFKHAAFYDDENQVRKLEFLMAEALEKGATAVITIGGTQSNHARATGTPHIRIRDDFS